ncbi:Uncharacterized membrane protein [Chitinophaga sp. YR573]|uniref:SRPBCC family protein n=1 Tax=Chitinophaga sp. YR573 TaxID=1881040 RepID=UPI0008D83454|nr:SRPBCC family protein [Chitinophaga sp. YR573]SEV91331.1 Uncharacterized membrane protein [Chitinophaga sp. YR573]
MSTYSSLNGHGEPRATALYEKSNILNVSKPGRIASIVSGAMLTTSAISNVDKHPFRSLLRLITGGYLLYRGISGNCPVSAAASGKRLGDAHAKALNIRKKLIVDKPRAEVYAFWRQIDNLPLFMKHIASVDVLDSYHSHWVVTGPAGIGKVEWDAEVIKEEPGSLIGWRSAAGSDIVTAGRVNFSDVPGGTAIEVNITYRPPARYVGKGLAWLLNGAFARIVEKDILSFKHFVETGVITI